MSVKFSHALLFGAAVCLATEVFVSLNRPLLADRWVSEKIQVKKDGKRHDVDANMEMDFFSKGFLTDPMFRSGGYAARFQFDGKDKEVGRVFGFPKESYEREEGAIRVLGDGFCDIKTFRRVPGSADETVFYTQKGCPNFFIRHYPFDTVVYSTIKDEVEITVRLKRKTRLNPLALAITVWNRPSYLRNPEEFMKNEPI